MAPMLALGGMAIDVGTVLQIRLALQAATEAAALAGGSAVNTSTASPAALTTATAWSATSGSANAIAGLAPAMVAGYPKTLCLNTLRAAPYNLPCTSPGGNAVQVAMSVQVPLVFGRLVGFQAFTVNTIATASAGGGTGTNLDIVLILDTTQSMASADGNCSVSGATRIKCAEAGARQLLNMFNPTYHRVALFTFPGLTPGTTVGREYCTPTGTISSVSGTVRANAIAYYNQTPVYQLVPFSTDYKTSASAVSLNTASNIVKAVGGLSGCTGLQVVGGAKTYYADVVSAAQTYLGTAGRPDTQKVIILLSDGDANAPTAPTTPTAGRNECWAAVAAAGRATAAGTWVYTLAYGAPSSGCATDSPAITPCGALQQMASKPTMFFSDSVTNCPSATKLTDLVAAFTKLGQTLQSRVLLPDDIS